MTSSEKRIIADIAGTIKRCSAFFIAGHIKPDGDTVGCALALRSLLRRLGKKAEIYTSEPIPDFLTFLKGIDTVILTGKVTKEYDCAIILECVDFERMGNLITAEQAGLVINIDHHSNSSNFGQINYVKPAASSSSEQVFNLFRFMRMPLTLPEAEALYAGLVTDTGKFQQTNTTPEAFSMAAELVRAGVKPSRMYDKLYATQSLSSLNLLGCSLNTLTTDPSGRIAYMEVTRAMYRATDSNVTETEGIINYSMMMPGVVVGILFRETETPGLIKVSFRSRDTFDVNKVSRHFGGGGHRNAAGCSIRGTMNHVQAAVLRYLRPLLRPKTVQR